LDVIKIKKELSCFKEHQENEKATHRTGENISKYLPYMGILSRIYKELIAQQ
jgi:hypothetical protein